MKNPKKDFRHRKKLYRIREREPGFFVVYWDVRGDGFYLSYDCVRAGTMQEAIEIFKLRNTDEHSEENIRTQGQPVPDTTA